MATPTLYTPPAAAPVNTAAFAKPGESIADYETRLGSTSGAAGSGTGFGTPAPIDPKLLSPSGGQSSPDPSADPLGSANDSVAKSLGYESYADALSKLTAPSEDTTNFYNDAYTSAGLDTLANSINQKQNDLNTATGNVNDNPWLDEASRVGRAKNLQTLANGDIKNLQDEYNTKLKNVQDLVTQHSHDLSATDASNKAKLSFLEAQAKAQAAQTTAQSKASTAAPKTIKGANGATFQYDPTTGTFSQILPGNTPKGSAGSGGSKGPVPPASSTGTGAQFNNFNYTAKQLGDLNAKGLNQDHANTILNEIKQGYTLDDIRQQMAQSGIDAGLLDTIMYYVDPAHNTPAKSTSSKGATSGRTT